MPSRKLLDKPLCPRLKGVKQSVRLVRSFVTAKSSFLSPSGAF